MIFVPAFKSTGFIIFLYKCRDLIDPQLCQSETSIEDINLF